MRAWISLIYFKMYFNGLVMFGNKLILGICAFMLCACGNHSLTTFKLVYPISETRNVRLETTSGWKSLVFGEGDSVQETVVQLSLTGGEYARLWVGDMSYSIWLEGEKPWIARFKWNEWHFEGEGASINNYLNEGVRNKVFFTDYYRIPNEQFREKLQDEMSERKSLLQKLNLSPEFVEQEMKRLRYIRNKHLASGVVYGEVKDGKINVTEDTRSELQKAIVEDSTSWDIFEYRESIDKVLLALAKMDGMGMSSYDLVREMLNMAIENYADKRLLEYLVYKNVMGYVKVAGIENIGELDSIFKQQVHTPEFVVAYEDMYRANKKLMKGQPAIPFSFKDMEGKEVSLSDFKGKYVYIDLWATWCGPCVAEIPYLKKLEKYFSGRDICFVSISSDKSRETWVEFVRKQDLKGVQLHMGEDKEYMKEIRCHGIPRFLLIDREGNFIDANMTRPSDPKTLERLEQLK